MTLHRLSKNHQFAVGAVLVTGGHWSASAGQLSAAPTPHRYRPSAAPETPTRVETCLDADDRAGRLHASWQDARRAWAFPWASTGRAARPGRLRTGRVRRGRRDRRRGQGSSITQFDATGRLRGCSPVRIRRATTRANVGRDGAAGCGPAVGREGRPGHGERRPRPRPTRGRLGRPLGPSRDGAPSTR